MAKYDLFVANDDAMPAGRDWLFIRYAEGDLMVVRRSALGDPKLIHEMWSAARTQIDARARYLRLAATG
jgi:hypothetical protein